jgi:polyisoprenoid-binding protein YceI
MKLLYTPILLLLLLNTAFAQLKPVNKSTITFQIKNLGINTGGAISGIQTNIHFNAAQLSTSIIEATADVSTINTDNDKRDEHLRSDEFFDVARYPKITMRSVSFRQKSGNTYVGRFDVTIKNKVKQFDIPFTYTETGNTALVKGSFKLNRLDFGVGGSSMVLSNDVTVNITVEADK